MTRLAFIKAWMSHVNLRGVSNETGFDTHQCSSIAARMREQGVDLPYKPRGRRHPDQYVLFSEPLDVPGLNKFIHER